MTPQEIISANPCVPCLTPGVMKTIQTLAAKELVTYIDQGGCPPGVIPPIPTPVDIYYGNYTWPDRGEPGASPPPVFTEAGFIGVNALYVDRQIRNTLTRAGQYAFPARAGVRQVMAIPQALGAPTFMVSGFPWSLTPAFNTPVQVGLTISGTICDVYFTSQQNTGGYIIPSNPVIIS